MAEQECSRCEGKGMVHVEDTCNMCGGTCCVPVSANGIVTNFVGGQYKYRGCYGSYALDDMTEYEFVLCEACLKKIFDQFKIPVINREYNFG